MDNWPVYERSGNANMFTSGITFLPYADDLHDLLGPPFRPSGSQACASVLSGGSIHNDLPVRFQQVHVADHLVSLSCWSVFWHHRVRLPSLCIAKPAY
jgi:hypothetical protein